MNTRERSRWSRRSAVHSRLRCVIQSDSLSSSLDRYLLTLASYAVRLVDVPIPQEWRDSKQGTGPGTWIGFNPGGDAFIVLHWRMEPRTVIRTHAHTYGNVCTLGLEGSIRARNFEMLEERDFDARGGFKVPSL